MTGPRPRLLLGTEHACSYLERRMARSVFVDPQLPLDATRYGALLELGFRRSGNYVYRPACGACQECRPARVPVAEFAPDRSQRRCLRDNADLRLVVEHGLDEEQYQLYRRYLLARHPIGGMDPDDREAFHAFLSSAWGNTEIVAARDGSGRLLAGGVVDRVPRALSAVYTWFDPDEEPRGLGTWMILAEIERARAMALPHLYLGYWVAGSPTMDYKRRYRPIEVLGAAGWERA
ncbi:MAG: arginyltransferase [Gammaproteobacteria bacterium]